MPRLISRQKAKQKGLPRYFTGRTCKRGHRCETYTAQKRCVECKRLVDLRNPAQIAARKRYDKTPKGLQTLWRRGHSPMKQASRRRLNASAKGVNRYYRWRIAPIDSEIDDLYAVIKQRNPLKERT